MERLNDIIGHTGLSQRRQPGANAMPQQATQGQRPQQAPAHSTPRMLREQRAYLGLRQAASGYPSSEERLPIPRPPLTQRARGPHEQQEGQPGPAQPAQDVIGERGIPRPVSPARPSYLRGGQQRPLPTTGYQQGTASPPNTQQALGMRTSSPARPRATGHYRHSDDYMQPPHQPDVMSQDEEEEEDTIGMRYGDWEDGENDLPPPRVHTNKGYQGSHTPSEPSYSAGPSPSQPMRSAYTTRDLRDARMPLASPVSQAEGRRYTRHTQPLEPRIVAAMGREGEKLPEPLRSTHLVPRQTQQVVVQEAVLQYTSVAVPPPQPGRAVCPLCKGAGYLRVDVPFGHPNFGKPVACECKEIERKEKRRQELLELSELSAFQRTSFKNFNTRFPGVHPSVIEAFQEAYAFAQNPNGWLVLIGPNGCGKTHLAAAIANQCLSNGAVVLFTVVPDLLAHLRSTFSPHATEAYDQRFAKMREAELLVLDDLGAHQGSPWANEKLFQLLNYRYNLGYPTVITANRQGWSTIDERIQSRLSDTGLVTTIIINGALDYRRQNPRRDLLR